MNVYRVRMYIGLEVNVIRLFILKCRGQLDSMDGQLYYNRWVNYIQDIIFNHIISNCITPGLQSASADHVRVKVRVGVTVRVRGALPLGSRARRRTTSCGLEG